MTRYRKSWTEPEMLKQGSVHQIRIILPSTSNLFKTGHRIRVDIASSNFPRLEVNPGTGEPVGRHTHTISAKNTIYFGGNTSSHVLLPIVPGKQNIINDFIENYYRSFELDTLIIYLRSHAKGRLQSLHTEINNQVGVIGAKAPK